VTGRLADQAPGSQFQKSLGAKIAVIPPYPDPTVNGRSRHGYEVGSNSAVVIAAAGAAAALGAVGAYSPKIAIAVLLGAAFVVLAMRQLSLAVAVFVVLTFAVHLPGSLGAGATLAKPVGALTLVAWAAIVLARRGSLPLLPRESAAWFWVIVGFVVFGGMSSLWAPDSGAAWSLLGQLLSVAGLALITFTAASSRSGFRTIIYGFLIASGVSSLYSIASGVHVQQSRIAALADPNYFAAELVPAIVIALFVFATTGSRRTRWLVAAVALVDLVAFVLTQSRGGIVGLIAGLIAAVVFAGRARTRVLVLVLVLMAIGLGYYLTFKPGHVFGGGVSGGLAQASSGRTDEWHVALQVFEGHPIGGVGLANFQVVEPAYATQTFNLTSVQMVVKYRQVAHNTYLEMAAELGAVGLCLFLAILALPLCGAARALARVKSGFDDLEFYIRGLVAGTIGILVAYVFLTAENEKPLWLLLALLASSPALLGRDRPPQPALPVAQGEQLVPQS
jgi:putative inorganic carbon (hco3(-)) transporter